MAISGWVSALDYEIPADNDMDNRYSLIMELSDGKDVRGSTDISIDVTLEIVVSVENVDEEGAVVFDVSEAVVDSLVVATLVDEDGVVAVEWQWSAGEDIVSVADSYIPVRADSGGTLFVVAHYEDGHGDGKTAMSELGVMQIRVIPPPPPPTPTPTPPIEPVPNLAPEFVEGERTTRTLTLMRGDGNREVGAAVEAIDPDPMDILMYTFVVGSSAIFTLDVFTGQILLVVSPENALDGRAEGEFFVRMRVTDGRGGSDEIDVTIRTDRRGGATDTDGHTDAHRNGNADCGADSDLDSNGDGDRDGDRNGDRDRNRDFDKHAGANSDRNGDRR